MADLVVAIEDLEPWHLEGRVLVWEGDVAYLMPKEEVKRMKSAELIQAEEAVMAAYRRYDELAKDGKDPYQRIMEGREYVQRHPEDRRAAQLLARLTDEVAARWQQVNAAWKAYWAAWDGESMPLTPDAIYGG